MPITQALNLEIHKLTPSALVQLFEMDFSEVENSQLPVNTVIYFYNNSSDTRQKVYFDNQAYLPIPCRIEGEEMKTEGKLARPKLRIANLDGFLSYYREESANFVGVKVTIKKTSAKYLNGTTWGLAADKNPFGTTPSGLAVISSDVFYVSKITSESAEFLELELISPLETQKLFLPKRRMFALHCAVEYRNSSTCRYAGVPVADLANKKFTDASGYNIPSLTDRGLWDSASSYVLGDYVYIESKKETEENAPYSYKRYYYVCVQAGPFVGWQYYPGFHATSNGQKVWVSDSCSKKLSGCVCRHPINNLPFGGFPGISRTEFVST